MTNSEACHATHLDGPRGPRLYDYRMLSRPVNPSAHRTRLVAGLALLPLIIGGVSACSGDTEEEPSAGASSATEEPGAPTSGCRAEVRVTGAVQARWEGKATVRLADPQSTDSAPAAVYTTSKDGNQLSVYSEGDGFETAATLAAGKRNFAADPSDTSGIEAETDGTEAQVDTTLLDVDGEESRLRAEFDCSGGSAR